MGEGIFGWRRDTEACQPAGLKSQPVTNIVKTHGVGEWGEEYRPEVAYQPGGRDFDIYAGFKGVTGDHSARYEVENLSADDTEWQGFQLNTSPLFRCE